MKMLKLGLILHDFRSVATVQEPDPVDLLVLRSTLANPPRSKGAESICEKLRKTHKNAEIIPYVWHLVSHPPSARLFSTATRSLPGNPQHFGHLQATDEVGQAWAITLQYAKAMQAKRLILRTPPSFTPSHENQNRLRRFVHMCTEQNLQLWWEVEGLWQQDLLFEIALELNLWIISPAFDRTGRVMEEHLRSQCLVVDSVGALRRFKGAMAENLISSIETSELTKVECVLFSGHHAFANLRAFATHWESIEDF